MRSYGTSGTKAVGWELPASDQAVGRGAIYIAPVPVPLLVPAISPLAGSPRPSGRTEVNRGAFE